MLVLDAARLQRQEQQVARFPIMALTVDFRPSLAFDNINDQAALMTVFSRVNFDVLDKNIPIVQHGLWCLAAIARWPHVMFHQGLARHDPRQFFATDDDLASKRPLALVALMCNDLLIEITLPRALSIASCHGSPSFPTAGYPRHKRAASRQSARNRLHEIKTLHPAKIPLHVLPSHTVPVCPMLRPVKYLFGIPLIVTLSYASP